METENAGKKPPLANGTVVDINIAQGLALARGIIQEAEYDEGWFYRIEVTAGNPCNDHRHEDGTLWVNAFEAKPVDADSPEPASSGLALLVSAAEHLLEMRDAEMVTDEEWDRLRGALEAVRGRRQ